MKISAEIQAIHEKALRLSKTYKKCEAELLEAVQLVREKRVYRSYGFTSAYDYCVQMLNLDPGVVYGFINVAKKISEVPELKERIKTGELNVSTARRFTSVLTKDNASEWLDKAKNLTTNKLEREVAKANPKEEIKEKASYLSSKRIQLILGLDEKVMLKLRRVQDLECQRQRKSVKLEDVVGILVEQYITKNDPIEKAKRAVIRAVTPTQRHQNLSARINSQHGAIAERQPIPAAILHKVHLRDNGECQYRNSITKQKCRQTRFLEIHHRIPVSNGGTNDLENLTTICAQHHKIIHGR